MKTTSIANDLQGMVRHMCRPDSVPCLPMELICNILCNLECRDLLECKRVSKLFKKLISETSRLTYIIDLHKYCMVPMSSTNSFSSRLELLRERERSWRTLSSKHRRVVNLPPTGSLYEFVGGVYANGKEGENRVTASISFIELPSVGIPFKAREGGVTSELKTWTHIMPELNIIDFTMDPIQDLLVLVVIAPPTSSHVYELHIRSIKNNQPHCKPPTSVFPCLRRADNHFGPLEIITAVRVQVCGDLVALLIKDALENTRGHLEIWNWEQGPKHSCQLPRAFAVDDFSFLTHDVCLIVRPTGRFEVYDFVDPRHESSKPTLRYSFAFPPLGPGYTYWYISMSSNPTPGCVPSAKDQANMSDFLKGNNQVYYPDPKDRVHACCLYVVNTVDPMAHAVSAFVFFLKIDVLLNPPMEWFDEEAPCNQGQSSIPYCHPSVLERLRLSQGYQPPKEETIIPDLNSFLAVDIFPTDESILPAIDLPIQGLPPPLASPSTSPIIPSSESDSVPITDDFLDPIPPLVPGDHAPTTSPPDASQSRGSESDREPIPWETWGPQNTRWFEECLSTDWQHAVYGMRGVESVDVSKMMNERRALGIWPAGGDRFEDLRRMNMASDGTGTGPEATTSSSSAPVNEGQAPNVGNTGINGNGGGAGNNIAEVVPKRERRFLRIRDFNPYAATKAALMEDRDSPLLKGKGKCRSDWRLPRIVSERSTVKVNGVFKSDITSSLPYVETVSDELYDVTDIMMDDCRLLLLKRGTTGRLQQMEVLMM